MPNARGSRDDEYKASASFVTRLRDSLESHRTESTLRFATPSPRESEEDVYRASLEIHARTNSEASVAVKIESRSSEEGIKQAAKEICERREQQTLRQALAYAHDDYPLFRPHTSQMEGRIRPAPLGSKKFASLRRLPVATFPDNGGNQRAQVRVLVDEKDKPYFLMDTTPFRKIRANAVLDCSGAIKGEWRIIELKKAGAGYAKATCANDVQGIRVELLMDSFHCVFRPPLRETVASLTLVARLTLTSYCASLRAATRGMTKKFGAMIKNGDNEDAG